MLEHKFHDHFYSGSIQLKLTDLTSVRQGRDETVSAYIKGFKETKNWCFNLSITDMDLADICLKGLRSSIRDKI
jgi:tmRNA-binding protein